MKVDLSPEEAALIQYAIVHTDEFWKPEGKHYIPKDELVQRILDKIAKIQKEEASEDLVQDVDSGNIYVIRDSEIVRLGAG